MKAVQNGGYKNILIESAFRDPCPYYHDRLGPARFERRSQQLPLLPVRDDVDAGIDDERVLDRDHVCPTGSQARGRSTPARHMRMAP